MSESSRDQLEYRTHNGHEETDVGLGQPVAHEVVLARQDLLKTVEGVEELVYCFFVCLLRRRKPRSVHSVCGSEHPPMNVQLQETRHKGGSRTVDGVIYPSIKLVDLAAKFLRIQVYRSLVSG